MTIERPCRADPEAWFAEDDTRAKELCNTACSAREACLVAGRLEPAGVWGGLDADERRKYRKRLQRLGYAAAKRAIA